MLRMNAITHPSPIRRAPIDLWRVAEAFLQTLHMLFGEPKDVARNSVVSALAHRTLASWLRCAEALLQRLLLIEAAALPTPNVPPPSRRHAGKAVRVRKLCEFWPDKPEDWRVSFRCFPPTLRQAQRDAGGVAAGSVSVSLSLSKAKRPGRQFRNAWPLAERYEALLRVFENPEPYARRLSRRLRAAPMRASALLQAPPEARHRIDGFDELTQAAAQGRDRFCDSS